MRLLVITHAFPPSRHSNAKRPWYLAQGFLDALEGIFFRVRQVKLAHRRGQYLVHPVNRVVSLVGILENGLHLAAEFFTRLVIHSY